MEIEELNEKIRELFDKYEKNVSANHYVPAIPQDSYNDLIQEIINSLPSMKCGLCDDPIKDVICDKCSFEIYLQQNER